MAEITKAEFAAIVDCHFHLVYRIAFRILGSRPDAEDAAQIVFTEAYRLHRSKGIQNWTGFLTRLTTRRSLDLARARRRNAAATLEAMPATLCDPHHELVGKEIADWLRMEIARLPEQQATVFALACFEEMDRSEIASQLGISVEAVSTSLHKARRKLQQRLSARHIGGSHEYR